MGQRGGGAEGEGVCPEYIHLLFTVTGLNSALKRCPKRKKKKTKSSLRIQLEKSATE